MDPLANFARQYAQQSRSETTDVLQQSQEIDAQVVDGLVRAQVGDKPGESKTASEIREEHGGRDPGEPTGADVERPAQSDSESAVLADAIEESVDSIEPETQRYETEEAAELTGLIEDVSEVAEPTVPVSDLGDRAEASQQIGDDSEPADLQQIVESTGPVAEPAAGVEGTGEDATVQQLLEDSQTLPITPQELPASRTVDLIPPKFPDEAKAALDRMPLNNTEISFSDQAAELLEIPDMGQPVSTMLETDAALGGLPFMSLFGDRRRDQ